MSDFFDQAAATWDADPRRAARARLIAGAIAAQGLGGVRDALEYGAGTGQVSLALADRLPHLHITDASPAMVTVARQRVAEWNALHPERAGRLEASELDLSRDAWPPATLDLIYAAMVMHHVEPLAPVLSAMAVALRPGGRLMIADLDHDPEHAFHGPDYEQHHGHVHHGFERSALETALLSSGFTAVTFDTIGTISRSANELEPRFPLFLAVAAREATE